MISLPAAMALKRLASSSAYSECRTELIPHYFVTFHKSFHTCISLQYISRLCRLKPLGRVFRSKIFPNKLKTAMDEETLITLLSQSIEFSSRIRECTSESAETLRVDSTSLIERFTALRSQAHLLEKNFSHDPEIVKFLQDFQSLEQYLSHILMKSTSLASAMTPLDKLDANLKAALAHCQPKNTAPAAKPAPPGVKSQGPQAISDTSIRAVAWGLNAANRPNKLTIDEFLKLPLLERVRILSNESCTFFDRYNFPLDTGLEVSRVCNLFPEMSTANYLGSSGSQGARLTVLLTDDDSLTRMYLKTRIWNRFKGLNIIEASGGKECLDIVNGEHPEHKLTSPYIIFLDVFMPDLGGIEVLKQIKAHPLHKDAVVFILTATQDQATIKSIEGLGCAGILLKQQLDQGLSAVMKLIQLHGE